MRVEYIHPSHLFGAARMSRQGTVHIFLCLGCMASTGLVGWHRQARGRGLGWVGNKAAKGARRVRCFWRTLALRFLQVICCREESCRCQLSSPGASSPSVCLFNPPITCGLLAEARRAPGRETERQARETEARPARGAMYCTYVPTYVL